MAALSGAETYVEREFSDQIRRGSLTKEDVMEIMENRVQNQDEMRELAGMLGLENVYRRLNKKGDNRMIEKIKEIICTYTYIEADELNELGNNYKLTEIGMDSVNIIYVIGELEEEYGFTLKQEDMLFEKLDTVNKIAVLVKRYQSAGTE